jgi:gluconolactonase
MPQPPASAPAAKNAPELPFSIVRLDPAFDKVVPPDAKLETLVTIPGMSGEGPLWYRGLLWVSDQRGGDIYTIDIATGAYRPAAEKATKIDLTQRFNMGPNGHVPYKNGETLVARQDVRDVARLGRDGKFTPLVGDYQGKRFNAPNDLLIGQDGTLWFSDPTFSVPAGQRDLPYAAVFRYREGVLTPVITDMNLPNGIGLSPDGHILYVNNTGPTTYVRAYDVARDGTLSNMRELVNFPVDPAVRGSPDGLKVDSAGNVWTTGPGGVSVISPQGKILGRIQFPQFTSNLAFGGADMRSVFFTSGPTVYRIHAAVAGQIPKYAVK